MTDNRFTQSAQTALSQAFSAAKTMCHSCIGSEHILLGVFCRQCAVTYDALSREGLRDDMLRLAVQRRLGAAAAPASSPALSDEAAAVIRQASELAAAQRQPYVSAEHLLLAILQQPQCGAKRILQDCGVVQRDLQARLTTVQAPPARPATARRSELKLTLQFGTDMTGAACAGYDPVIGRDAEVTRLIQILTRRQKSNPVLVGEAGVGKTAIVEHLAQRIAAGKAPRALLGKRIISLNLAGLVSGTKYRGEFEERTRAVLEEVKNAGDVILFIDEMHMLAGAGAAEGAIDAANIFKPALSRGQLQLIGATTLAEYKKYIRQDKALERRFQTIQVCQPTPAQTVHILKALRPRYEEHHGIKITDGAIDAAVSLSQRYLVQRFFPDKAIDLLDEAAAQAALQGKWCAGEEDVRQVLQQVTGVQAAALDGEERQRLLALPTRLHRRVIGQDRAVETVAQAVRRCRTFGGGSRPAGSFLFCGPSGVGKTSLAKALAEAVFGSEEALIRLDMSEYMEPHSVSRLIGSPPGYVGYGEGGLLTEKIRRTPYSVVLLDEVEKAHPDVLNLLLQILEDGMLTDSQGEQASFCSAIVILTSNVGLHGVMQRKTAGFVSPGPGDLEKQVRAAVKTAFRPELLGRIDEVVVFHPLEQVQLQRIAALELEKLAQRMAQVGLQLSWDGPALELLADCISDPCLGARPLRQAIIRQVEDPAAELWLQGRLEQGARVTVHHGALQVCPA